MPVSTRRQSSQPSSGHRNKRERSPEEQINTNQSPTLQSGKRQRRQQSQSQEGVANDNNLTKSRKSKKVDHEEQKLQDGSQSHSQVNYQQNQQQKKSLEIEGQVYEVNDYVYVRMECLSDEEEQIRQSCQLCKRLLHQDNNNEEDNDEEQDDDNIYTCANCAQSVHFACLQQLNKNSNYENLSLDEYLAWTCSTCNKHSSQSSRNSSKNKSSPITLSERLACGQLCIYLAQIKQFLIEDGEQLVQLQWFYSLAQDDPEIDQLKSQMSIKDCDHCKCVLSGPNCSNEVPGVIVRKASIVFDKLEFAQQTNVGKDVFLCVGELYQEDGDEHQMDNDGYFTERDEEGHGMSWSSMDEDGDYDVRSIRSSRRTSMMSVSSRRKSQGGNIRQSLIDKFEAVQVKLFDEEDQENQPNTSLELAKKNLGLNYEPHEFPCRDSEKQKIKDFLIQTINGKGGCLYVSGIPGTGKTATVREVVRVLKLNQQSKYNNNEFKFVEINALKLPNPRSLYSVFCEQVCEQVTSQSKAQQTIEDYFTNAPLLNARNQNTKPCVVLVDEVDKLITKNQQILYNLFEWPLRPCANLSVIAISNTMDLPEKLLPRIASRIANSRLIFKPYKAEDVEIIIKYRLGKYVDCYNNTAIKLVARKVGTLAGDVRKAMELLKRATEIAQNDRKNCVSSSNVQEAIKELYADPVIQYVCNASLLQKILLAAVIMQKKYGNCEENGTSAAESNKKNKIQLHSVLQRAKQYSQSCGVFVGSGGIQTALSGLESVGLIVLQPKGARAYGTIKINAIDDNIVFMLKQDNNNNNIPLFQQLAL